MSFLTLGSFPSPTTVHCSRNSSHYEAHTTQLPTTKSIQIQIQQIDNQTTDVSSSATNTFILNYNGRTVASGKSIITVSVSSTLTLQYTSTNLHNKLFVCHNENTTDRVFDRYPFLIIPNVQQSDHGIYEVIVIDGDVNTRLYFMLRVKTSYSATDTSNQGKGSLPTNSVTTEETNGYTRRLTSTIVTTSSHNKPRLQSTSKS